MEDDLSGNFDQRYDLLVKERQRKGGRSMLDLSNIFNKDIKKAILSKEQLAEMLKVTPEAFLKE